MCGDVCLFVCACVFVVVGGGPRSDRQVGGLHQNWHRSGG